LDLYFNVKSFFIIDRSPKRRKRSPTPRPTKVHIGQMTRNVNKDHIQEIFSVYGTLKGVDVPTDRAHPNYIKGFAYIEYENPDDAEKAIKYMNGGRLKSVSSI
jgi:RNA-binding protein with serine-rich domain 1